RPRGRHPAFPRPLRRKPDRRGQPPTRPSAAEAAHRTQPGTVDRIGSAVSLMDTGPSGDIVVVENLTKRFGAVEAVSGLDFAVSSGGITALLGANGAGKSTTIAILLGLLKPTSGRVTVMG